MIVLLMLATSVLGEDVILKPKHTDKRNMSKSKL